MIKIRDRYAEIQKWISDEFLTPAVVTTSVNRPAIGPQNTTINFYWNNMSSESYEGDGEDYVVNRVLYFVTVEYNIAASVNYHIEYLYNDKAELIFCFYQEATSYDTKFIEIRYYYDCSKLIKHSYKEYMLKEDMTMGDLLEQKEISEKFSKEILTQATEYTSIAARYLESFNSLLELESVH